ncbi:MAG: FAD-dependent oxidoreductase [Actinomycetaceae bacterium]|nr:FAD-dependent oxidoreductase [Actinomycetaceae bacterium]
MKLIVVGGVAAGMSAAARARRLDEKAEIIVFEAGPYVSFANCGLPYHVGKEIEQRDSLLLHTPQTLKSRANLDVRVDSTVTKINRAEKTVTVAGPNGEYTESYDKLILAPGADAVMPPVPGLELPVVHGLRTIPQMDDFLADLEHRQPKHVTVLGAGFIGLEAVEALVHQGYQVTLVEAAPQVMPLLEPDLAVVLHRELRKHGVDLRLGVLAQRIEETATGATVHLSDGSTVETGLILASLGVRPRSELAKDAGLELSERGAVIVDENQVTSDPDILAAGDVVQVRFHDGRLAPIFLAGPANRQGRRAADQALGHATIAQKPVLGTAVVRVFDVVAAVTGANSRALEGNAEYTTVRVHGSQHAGYYPGAQQIHLTGFFAPDGRLLGAQAVGPDGADKRIDVLATALRAGMTADDLAELELCYSPPIGSAKDLVNMLGFTAGNILFDNCPTWDWKDIPEVIETDLVLDVRNPAEVEGKFKLPQSLLIPLPQLRDRIDEVIAAAAGRRVSVHCQSGLRSYLAQRILKAHGIECQNFSGGAISLQFGLEVLESQKK